MHSAGPPPPPPELPASFEVVPESRGGVPASFDAGGAASLSFDVDASLGGGAASRFGAPASRVVPPEVGLVVPVGAGAPA